LQASLVQAGEQLRASQAAAAQQLSASKAASDQLLKEIDAALKAKNEAFQMLKDERASHKAALALQASLQSANEELKGQLEAAKSEAAAASASLLAMTRERDALVSAGADQAALAERLARIEATLSQQAKTPTSGGEAR